jgi:hypothetical protein
MYSDTKPGCQCGEGWGRAALCDTCISPALLEQLEREAWRELGAKREAERKAKGGQ